MSKRDHEVVEDYKKIFGLVSPHLHPVEGNWYIFENEQESERFLEVVDEFGYTLDTYDVVSVDNLRKRGFIATPVLIYKVDTDRLR